MYRGIIEGAQWAKEGTYLREKIKQHHLDKSIKPRPYLAPHLRRHRARPHDAADAERDARAAGRAPRASQRLVARHGSATARVEAGPVRRAGAREHGPDFEESAGARACAVDARRAGRAQSRRWRGKRSRDPDAAMRIARFERARRSTRPVTVRWPTTIAALDRDPDTDVVIQAMLTLNVLKTADAAAVVKAAMDGQCGSRRAVRRRPDPESTAAPDAVVAAVGPDRRTAAPPRARRDRL